MSGELVALVVGTLLAVGALMLVLYPLFFKPAALPARATESLDESSDNAIAVLREIEFDRATGKLSEQDYSQLKGAYAARALQAARDRKALSAAELEDPVEARVRLYRMTHRECADCGLRPEVDALYCSNCGARIA